MKRNYLQKTKTGLKTLMAGLFLFGAVSANAQCTANFTFATGPNGSVNFGSTSTGTTISTAYFWDFGSGNTLLNPTPSHTYTSNGFKWVCLTIISNSTSATSCTSTVCDSVLITNAPTPTTTPCAANFNFTTGPGGLVTFTNTSTGTTGSTAYSWNFGNGFTSNSQNPSHIYTTNGPKIVCLTITSNTTVPGSCTSTFCDTVWVTTLPTPTCQASFNYATGPGGIVNFTNTSSGTGGSTAYIWNYGDGSPNGSGQTPSHTYSSNGLKTVCLTIITNTTTVNSCTSTVCDTFYVTTVITPTAPCTPTVIYTLSKDTTQALTWNAYPNYPANITGATWYWGDGSSSTGLYPSHTYSAAGSYSTCVTISVSCSSLTATYCYVATIFKVSESAQMIALNVKPSSGVTGIKDQKLDNKVSIYPNPNNGEFVLELNTNDRESTIYIYNIMGEKVAQKQVSGGKQTVDVSYLANGTYIVNINSAEGSMYKKITIQK